jgi:hypothetical protein
MGEKKKKEATTKKLKQVLIVGACVLFVVLMIISGMGSGWISSFAAVKPGDVAVIDYTFYDAIGNPIVTSNQQIYEKSAAGGRGILGSKQIQIVANQSLVQAVIPVSVISSSGGTVRQFAIFSPEYDTISSGIVGMKTNEQKRFIISSQPWMTRQWSADDLEPYKMNITDINVGDSFFLGVSDNPELPANSTATTYLRVAEVIRKGPTTVVVDLGYPVVDVQVVSINKR